MRRIEESFARPILAALAGALIGFVIPHVRSAAAVDARSAVVIGDDGKKSDKGADDKSPDDMGGNKDKDADKDLDKGRCVCDKIVCTNSDGMRNVNAPCGVKCPEGKVAKCECGKCAEDGQFERRNTCQCKAE